MARIGGTLRMLHPLWRNGHRYLKAGVILNDLVLAESQTRMLFATRHPVKSANRHRDHPRLEHTARAALTRYTTCLEEILVATAW